MDVVFETIQPECINCGSTRYLFEERVVPIDRGGCAGTHNRFYVCRDCQFLRSGPVNKEWTGESRMMSVWLSSELYESVRSHVSDESSTFNSLSALARYLSDLYITQPDNFDDVGFYQDTGMGVKVNFLMPKDMREALKEAAFQQRLAVSDVIKGLYKMYLSSQELPANIEVKQ